MKQILGLAAASVAGVAGLWWFTSRPAGPDRLGDVAEVGGGAPAPRIYEAYKGYTHMTPGLANKIVEVAADIGANPYDLAAVLRHESQFNPRAQGKPGALIEEKPKPGSTVVQRRYAYNPQGGATGILQWLHPEEYGVSGTTLWGLDSVAQMDLVRKYFLAHGDVSTKDRLFMAVFFPDYMGAPLDRPFPENVRAANPGTNAPLDYIANADKYRLLDGDGQPTGVRSRLGTYLVHPDERPAILAQRAEPLAQEEASVGADVPDLLLVLVRV